MAFCQLVQPCVIVMRRGTERELLSKLDTARSCIVVLHTEMPTTVHLTKCLGLMVRACWIEGRSAANEVGHRVERRGLMWFHGRF